MTLAPWRTCSIFVSSTFDDMYAERDHLQQVVFPALAEWLRERRVNLEITDLRWGVETMSIADREAKELAVLKVCLAEVDRSRPFLLVLLGDRYGWEPPVERVRQATHEMGFAVDDRPRSVTALEVDYGVLRARRPMRPRFYFREPLPYPTMPPDIARRYTDEATAPTHFALLGELKRAISASHGELVRHYATAWSPQDRRPADLTAFGEQVLADLTADLEVEFGGDAFASVDDEDLALDAFVEERSRDAQGRDAILDELADAALGGSPRPLTVLVAGPGTGKSVVFARLARRLAVNPAPLVLVHAAGVTPASLDLGAMLRRWCVQLTEALGTPQALPSDTDPALRQGFARLLSGVAASRRVVLLVDALDQFERTPEARHLTWLPAQWPENACLIATTGPGSERGALLARGAVEITLEPLTPDESAAISAQLCARWHKVLPRAVDDALQARHTAVGNPLWLSLAVSELLLLDADDFEAARDGAGTPEERLLHLLVTTVTGFPDDLAGAYAAAFEHAEQAYGGDLVVVILRRLATARFGLRETDLEAMFRAHPGWDGSILAILRRALRAHLGERGAARQWTFTHQQAREAALARYTGDPAVRRAEHAAIAKHLLGLPEGDPLRHEILHHLAEADDVAAARDYWPKAPHGDELDAAYRVLRQRLTGPDGDASLGLATGLLPDAREAGTGDSDMTDVVQYLAGQRLLQFSEEVLSGVAPERAADLLQALDDALRDRPDPMAEEVRYRALQTLAMVQLDQGDPATAAQLLAAASEINARHLEGRKRALERIAEPEQREVQTLFYNQTLRDRMINLQRLGRVQRSTATRAEARASFEAALEIAQYFATTYPGSELGANDLASGAYLVADLLFDDGDIDAALSQWQRGLDALKPEVVGTDARASALRIHGHRGMGRGTARLFRLTATLSHLAQAMMLAEQAARQDPGDATLQWQFLRTAEQAAEALALTHASQYVLRCWQRSLEICQAMVYAGLVDGPLVQYMVRAQTQRALALEVLGDEAGARAAEAEARQLATLIEPTT
jgi:tetratricopeptide (TPR) repeat protein